MSDFSERAEDMRGWALSRIRHCRDQERKFTDAWTSQMRAKHQLGPPQSLVEAWSERIALQAVLEMMWPGFLARHDARGVAACASQAEKP
jgi:predicted DNA-binding transcriptional regulator YafY